MYGHPKYGMYGFKPNPSGRKRGRPSNLSKFLDRQRDMFPVELAMSVHAPHPVPGAGVSARSDEGARTEAPAQGNMFHGNVSRNDLYVLVTRKGSAKNCTNHPYRRGKAGGNTGRSA